MVLRSDRAAVGLRAQVAVVVTSDDRAELTCSTGIFNSHVDRARLRSHLSRPRPGSGLSDAANVSSNKRCERESTGSVTVS